MNTTETRNEYTWKNFQRRRDTFEEVVTKRIVRALNAQLDQFLEGTEGIQTPGEWNANLLNVTEQPIKEAFLEIYPLVGVYFAQTTNRELNRKYKAFTFKDQADDMTSNWLSFMRNYAINEAGERITKITLTTPAEIRKVLEKGIVEGLGAKEIGRNLKKRFSEITQWRGRMIARTEIVSASNKGALEGAKSTGLNLGKTWLATPQPGRTREPHLAAGRNEENKVIPLNEDFEVGGERLSFPGDPKGSADNTINCRCTQVFEPI